MIRQKAKGPNGVASFATPTLAGNLIFALFDYPTATLCADDVGNVYQIGIGNTITPYTNTAWLPGNDIGPTHPIPGVTSVFIGGPEGLSGVAIWIYEIVLSEEAAHDGPDTWDGLNVGSGAIFLNPTWPWLWQNDFGDAVPTPWYDDYFTIVSSPDGAPTSVDSGWTFDGVQGNSAVAYIEGSNGSVISGTQGCQGVTFSPPRGSWAASGFSFRTAAPTPPTQGRIIVRKVTHPSGDPQSFSFSTSYSGGFSLTDGQSNDSGLLDPGTYSVSEDAVANWAVSTSQDPSAIVVTAGVTTIITFTNTFTGPTQGNIIISKVTSPSGSSQAFSFTSNYGAPFTLSDGQSNNSGPIAPGSYSVSEAAVTGWDTSTDSDPTRIVVTAGNTSTVTFTNTLTTCVAPSASYDFIYIKSFPLTSGQDYTVALDFGGRLWVENVNSEPFVFRTLFNGIIPGTYMLSTTQDDFEYMCFSNLLNGTDIPRQYNPQPAEGGFTLDRISQVGPGLPPTFQGTGLASAGIATITSWAGTGSGSAAVVTFQAVNTFTAGEVVTLSGFAVSTFFNGRVVTVLGTGLSGTQFEVRFAAYSGGTDTGLATPQYGYNIQSINQKASVFFDNQTILWSSGPDQVTPGTTITCYYGGQGFPQDPNLVAAFNSGLPCYVYITGAPFGNGTQLVTQVGLTGKPPSQSGPVPYFTFAANSSAFQIVGDPPGGSGNLGTFQLTYATLVTQQSIPNLSTGDQIVIAGASPTQWNAEWTITQATNSGVYIITATQMTNGNATYSWTWAGTGAAITPNVNEMVTVVQTLNGNGIFNVVDANISSVTGGPNSGTFVISALGAAGQTVPLDSAENGQAQTSGRLSTFDPGSITYLTTTSPIYGNAIGNQGLVVTIGSNTSIAAGTRQAVVFFETRNGLKTACSAPITFTTTGVANYLVANNIPIGPPNVIRRWIAFTSAGPNGIAGPNFYTIDAPVTYTINNQNFLYSATYVDDNITTTAQFTFTDAVLLAGEEIDVQGNNLFAQIELGSSAWNIAYAQRMFYGLEQNKVLNFVNMSFDGGYIPTGSSLTPLGWSLDLASNIINPTPATITAFAITELIRPHQTPQRVVVFTANNTFVVGMEVTISGLSTGTYLNGVVLRVLLATATSFTATFQHATVSVTADSGFATPIIVGGTLVESTVFGDAYYINNQTNSTEQVYGMIIQNAYQDAYNVPIILPNTLYSVRVTARIPSGLTTGNLIIDLTGSNSTVSGTGYYSTGYGITYGQFILPFSSMSEDQNIYSGTLLTTPFLRGVPVGLVLRVWANNIGAGADVEIDRIEVFPTATPTLSTNVRVSYVDNFEAFDANTGNIGLAAHNTQPCFGAFEMHDQLYFLQSGSMQSTQDVPGVEPSNPGGGWAVHEVSNRVGTCGIHAYDYGEEWILTACRNGIYGFNGGQPIRIDFQQRELWEMINWKYGHTIWLRNDLPNSRLLVGVPLPTPNRWLPLAPSNPNPTSPNVMFVWNYQNLDTFEEIVSGRGVHTTMFGTLAAVDMRLKMTIWQISSPYAGFITQPDLATEELTICNGQGNQKIYQLSDSQFSDDGVAINSFYATWGFMSAAKAKENPLLGLHRKRFQFVQQWVTGSGNVSVKAYPNYLLNPQTLAFNQYLYTVPNGINLSLTPIDDIIRPLNMAGNRVYLSYSTNAVGSSFHLSKVILVGTIDPYTAVNPNSG